MSSSDKQGVKKRGWAFTINNPDLSADSIGRKLAPKVSYYIFQLEKGENGTPHYQGFLYLKKRNRFTYVRKYLPDGTHIEATKGSPAQNISYCSKDDTRVKGPLSGPFTFGEAPAGQGKRNDLVNLFKDIKGGMSNLDIFKTHTNAAFKYRKGINDAKMLVKATRAVDFEPDVRLYIGPTGTGKTRSAREEFPDCYVVPIGRNLWFDGYDGQHTVLIDDFSGNIGLTDLLRLLDLRYIDPVPVKGSFVNFLPVRVIVTTNNHPSTWYQNTGRTEGRRANYMALARRFNLVREYLDKDLLENRHIEEDYVSYMCSATIKDYFN